MAQISVSDVRFYQLFATLDEAALRRRFDLASGELVPGVTDQQVTLTGAAGTSWAGVSFTFEAAHGFTEGQGTWPDGDVRRVTIRDGDGVVLFNGELGAGLSVATLLAAPELAVAGDDLVTGSDGADVLFGGGGADRVVGGLGADVLFGGAGDDVLVGGEGRDVAAYWDAATGVTVALGVAGAQNTGGAGLDTLDGIEGLLGSGFADVLIGDGRGNVITGGAGGDILMGGAGDDQLIGEAGHDHLYGGVGNDVLVGGAGFDYARYDDAGSGVSVSLASMGPQATGGAGVDILSGMEALVGSAFGDTLCGDAGGNEILGGAGDDQIYGGDGGDRLSGGDGRDTFYFAAVGESGAAGRDTLTDFDAAAGDTVVLAGIDANVHAAGDQAFVWAGAFSGAAGEAVLSHEAGTNRTTLSLDVDGDGRADFSLMIEGSVPDVSGFVL